MARTSPSPAPKTSFAHRYDTNVVQPTLAAADTDIDAAGIGLFESVTSINPFLLPAADQFVPAMTVTATIPAGHTGVIEVGFTAESVCSGGSANSYCKITLVVNGQPIDDSDFAFDSSDNLAESASSWEGHAVTRVTIAVPADIYTVTILATSINGAAFRVDDMTLTATVHLAS